MKAIKIMRKTRCLILIVMALCSAAVLAQKKRGGGTRTPVFSSVYTDMAKGRACRTIEEEMIGCRPVGGYRVFAGYHNVLERIWIETTGGEEVTDIPSDRIPGISRNIGKIEWRLADGKPFAVIARFVFYSMEDIEADKDLSPNISQFTQMLSIKGLDGSEQIDAELDVKTTPNPNQKARDLADAGFMKSLKK